jgi:hypothetical protein
MGEGQHHWGRSHAWRRALPITKLACGNRLALEAARVVNFCGMRTQLIHGDFSFLGVSLISAMALESSDDIFDRGGLSTKWTVKVKCGAKQHGSHAADALV